MKKLSETSEIVVYVSGVDDRNTLATILFKNGYRVKTDRVILDGAKSARIVIVADKDNGYEMRGEK